ncbi:MAG: hypothetical protein LBQ44_09595 [Treponema sp.]|jgi:hypothetical protein|nr:hypothetical protein [Treponema sp.]
MSITQTVEVPDSHRLTIEVPREIPAGPVVLTFTPQGEARPGLSRDTPEYLRRKAMEEQSIKFINRHAEELNREAEDVLTYQIDPFELVPPDKEEP